MLTLTNRTLPFSVAATGLCVGCEGRAATPEERALNGSRAQTQLLLQNYVPPTHAGRAMDLWLQARLAWWKNYARHPAQFTVDSFSHDKDDPFSKTNSSKSSPDSRMSIYFHFPWGRQCVETLHNTRDLYLNHLDPTGDYRGHSAGSSTKVHAELIECSTTVEKACLAWLWDAFSERESVIPVTSDGKHRSRNVLHLHNRLAPYQCAVVCHTPADPGDWPKMRMSAAHLVRRLAGRGVRVFDASTHGSNINAHINRCDELGVPYTIIISESTLADGVLGCRVRDTEIEMSSHITYVADQIADFLRAEQHSSTVSSTLDPDLLTSPPDSQTAPPHLTSQPPTSVSSSPSSPSSSSSPSLSSNHTDIESQDNTLPSQDAAFDKETVVIDESSELDHNSGGISDLEGYDGNLDAEGKCVQISFGDDSLKGVNFDPLTKSDRLVNNGTENGNRGSEKIESIDNGSDADEDKFTCGHENHIIRST